MGPFASMSLGPSQISESGLQMMMVNAVPAAPPPPMIQPPDPTKCVLVSEEEILNKMRERYYFISYCIIYSICTCNVAFI